MIAHSQFVEAHQLCDRLVIERDGEWRATGADIKRAVSTFYQIEIAVIAGDRRTAEVYHARMAAMYLCATFANYSNARIGRYFGDRDPSTVLWAIRKAKKLLSDSDEFRGEVESLCKLMILTSGPSNRL